MSYSVVLQNDAAVSLAKGQEREITASVPTDKQLVEAVLAGSEPAFEQIFDRHKRLAISVIGRYFHKMEEVEEVVQVVFTKVYFELPKFRGENELSLASWISRIASNSCVDLIRKIKHRPEGLTYEMPDREMLMLSIPDPHDSGSEDRLVERDLANKLLSQIDRTDRVILEMLHSEGMSIGEAAEVMGWSESRTKMRAWRARRALRKLVERLV